MKKMILMKIGQIAWFLLFLKELLELKLTWYISFLK